jgi:chaperone modulatory protein CbpM
MIVESHEFILQAQIDGETLQTWVEAGWLMPRGKHDGRHYTDVDLARANLIGDLQDLGVNDEGIPIILDLVDQMHGLRRMLRELLPMIKAQHEGSGL